MSGSEKARVRRRHQRSGTSGVVVPLLVVLSIVASVFLIRGDSVEAMRIGMVVAMWLVVLAAVAVTRFRKESEADRGKVRDLRINYELQLSREMSARRRHEMTVESKLRQKLAVEERGDSAAQISALRQELGALRGQLELIFGKEIAFDRTALVGAQAPALQIEEAKPAEAAHGGDADVVDAEFESDFAGPTAGRSVPEVLEELRESERAAFADRAVNGAAPAVVAASEQVRF